MPRWRDIPFVLLQARNSSQLNKSAIDTDYGNVLFLSFLDLDSQSSFIRMKWSNLANLEYV